MTSLVVLSLLAGVPLPQECEPPPLHDVAPLKTFAQKSGTLSVGLDSVATWCFDSGGAWTAGQRPEGKKPKPIDPNGAAVGDCARALTSCDEAKLALTDDLTKALTDSLADLERPYRGQKYTPKRTGLNERPNTAVNCKERSRPDLFAQAQSRMDMARLASTVQNEYANYKTWLFARGLECAQQVRSGKVDTTRVSMSLDTPGAGGGTAAPGSGGGAAVVAKGSGGGAAVGVVGAATTPGKTGALIVANSALASGGGTAGTGSTTPNTTTTTVTANPTATTTVTTATTPGKTTANGATTTVTTTGTTAAGTTTTVTSNPTVTTSTTPGKTTPMVTTPTTTVTTPNGTTVATANGTTVTTPAGPGKTTPNGTTVTTTTGTTVANAAGTTVTTPNGTTVTTPAGTTVTTPSGTTTVTPSGTTTTANGSANPPTGALVGNTTTPTATGTATENMLETWRGLATQRAKMELDRDYTLGFLASRELRDCRCQRSSPAGIVSRLETQESVAQLEADHARAVACERCLQNAFAGWRSRISKQCSLMNELSQYELEVLQRSDDGNGLPPRCWQDVVSKRGLDGGVLLAVTPNTAKPPPTTTTVTIPMASPDAGNKLATVTQPTGVPRFEPTSPLADGFFRPSEPAPMPLREDGRLYVRVFMSSTCAADVLPGPLLARTGDLLLIPYGAKQLSLRSPCGGLAEVYWGREPTPRVSEVFGRNQPLHLQFKAQ